MMHRAVLSRYTGYVAGARPALRALPASVSHLHAGRPCAVPGPEHRPGKPPFGEEPRVPGEEAYLPEDQEPAPWQRYAQLIAGTVGAGTLVYFVLFADYGDGEHCFRPVRTSPHKLEIMTDIGARASFALQLRRILHLDGYNPFKEHFQASRQNSDS